MLKRRILHRADGRRDVHDDRQNFPGGTFRPSRHGLRVQRRRRRKDARQRR